MILEDTACSLEITSFVLLFQDPMNLHKKFIDECYKRLEVGGCINSEIPQMMPIELVVMNVIYLTTNQLGVGSLRDTGACGLLCR